MDYTLTTTLATPYDETVAAVREALAEQGFGVLTEIDVRATMAAKLEVEVPAQIILGACRPPLAYAALQVEPSIGTLLPCNVVVRETPDGTVVEAADPAMMTHLTDNAALDEVATEARTRIVAALDSLGGSR